MRTLGQFVMPDWLWDEVIGVDYYTYCQADYEKQYDLLFPEPRGLFFASPARTVYTLFDTYDVTFRELHAWWWVREPNTLPPLSHVTATVFPSEQGIKEFFNLNEENYHAKIKRWRIAILENFLSYRKVFNKYATNNAAPYPKRLEALFAALQHQSKASRYLEFVNKAVRDEHPALEMVRAERHIASNARYMMNSDRERALAEQRVVYDAQLAVLHQQYHDKITDKEFEIVILKQRIEELEKVKFKPEKKVDISGAVAAAKVRFEASQNAKIASISRRYEAHAAELEARVAELEALLKQKEKK